MYKVKLSHKALKDLGRLKNAGLRDKTKSLLDLIAEDSLASPPAYEALVGNLSGLHSRRINRQHRLVYRFDNDSFVDEGIHYQGTVFVLRAWTHYDDVR